MPRATFVFYIWRMNSKWYLSTLLLILLLFGYSQQQRLVPNQEIVVQFTHENVGVDEAANAIATVKQQLQNLGVENIQVREYSDGNLKIAYYSKLEVSRIQQILSNEPILELGYNAVEGTKNSSEPSNDSTELYKLNVCEIQTGSNIEMDLKGYLHDNSLAKQRLLNPVFHYPAQEVDFKLVSEAIHSKKHVNRNVSLSIDNAAYIIPETRAGPTA